MSKVVLMSIGFIYVCVGQIERTTQEKVHLSFASDWKLASPKQTYDSQQLEKEVFAYLALH